MNLTGGYSFIWHITVGKKKNARSWPRGACSSSALGQCDLSGSASAGMEMTGSAHATIIHHC